MATPERAGREPHPEICLPIFESVAGIRQRRTGTAEHRNALLGCWLISGDRDGPARGRLTMPACLHHSRERTRSQQIETVTPAVGAG
jgi:hypothetical protein